MILKIPNDVKGYSKLQGNMDKIMITHAFEVMVQQKNNLGFQYFTQYIQYVICICFDIKSKDSCSNLEREY